MKREIIVGISDYKISKNPNRLITYALGSCVGIAVYDKKHAIGGLSHIQLYNSTLINNKGDIKRYADTAIPYMVREMLNYGADQRHLVAKIAGGANMFAQSAKVSFYDIGKCNVKAVQNILESLKIPLVSQDVGGKTGRTMIFDLDNFDVYIKYINNINKQKVKI